MTASEFEALPEPLRQLRRFLVYRDGPRRNGKITKVPYYANGRMRNGTLDTPEDLGQLVTLQEVLDAFVLGEYAGIGFALVAADQIGAFDLDACLDANGDLIPSHSGAAIATKARAAGAYIEVSPSGSGLRILGPCAVADAYSKDGTEFWGEKRFVTVTGNTFANAGGWADLTQIRRSIARARTRVERDDDGEGGIITPRTVDELHAALESIPSDDRDLWVRMGMALKSMDHKQAKPLWLEWSAKSDKFDAADADRVWDGLNPQSTSYKAVFAEAQENWGWKNPRKRGNAKRDGGKASSFEGVTPLDLWTGYAAPELPTGLLPQTIENFARRQAGVMGIDPAGLAMAALAVAAASISDDVALQVKQHDRSWRESARVWIGLVGAPSTKKSPIIKEATKPLRDLDSIMAKTYAAKCAEYDRLPAQEKRETERPKQQRRIISDATIEAAQEVLKDSPWGLLSVQDELSGWFGAMDKYAPGKASAADRGFWLQSFNGGPYSANRIGRGAVFVPNCSVSLIGGIQPEPLRKIADDTVDDGLIQRLIPVILRPGHVGSDQPSGMAVTEYAELIRYLTRHRDTLLKFDAGGRTVRERLEREHMGLSQALEPTLPKLAAHFGKYDGIFARLCVLWHVVEHAEADDLPDIIEAHTAERVASFMAEFLRPSAVAFYVGKFGITNRHDDLTALASFIVAYGLDAVDARTVQRSAGAPLRSYTADQVRQLCERLSNFGWLEPEEIPHFGKTPTRWLVNPQVFDRFKEHGVREIERRAAAKEAIENVFQQ